MSLNHQELTAVVNQRISHCGRRNELYSLRKLLQVSLSIPSSHLLRARVLINFRT
jgi:hypothetical protein